ncbi:hypothetical protein Ple7327_0447 [Pleurocapsa sp. PCC 7327]|uniref:DUF2330 domain-containing protein n=1 Tax=Pleurocapsa sp. PCC 7327 TaxID=118163 RepID=UPI00029FDFFC|nr:DUF2330 domain-containing protein [Pleurocapsa sp. PCC 7327]AFY75903.1 hypothetical protein Ple7327_0447 [Pleurocapsa sp. PCC 7327]
MKIKRLFITLILLAIAVISFPEPARAFCGFYVAKADAKLYNKSSQVIIARNGDRTVLTMANDYQGEIEDFALVVPVPVILTQEQVQVGNSKIIERLDAFSAPRLVEYFDSDPCGINVRPEDMLYRTRGETVAVPQSREKTDNALGVTVEQQFTVGEYDIVILSAKESNGLETWLKQNGYKIPSAASQLLSPYIRGGLKFFVAKVNLQEYANTGFKSLRPLMMAYESPKFMLPIRLGMINAKDEQDLIVYLLSPKGQIELTNYRTIKIPSDIEVPEFIAQEFKNFYQAMFKKSHERAGKKIAFLEYTWDTNNCDPCSAQPLNSEELKQAGVFWLNSDRLPNVFITRLRVRYARDKFPEDLQFQETANHQLFQGRYIIHHPYREEANCDAAKDYYQSVKKRQEKEAQTLVQLTGWNINEILKKINFVEAKQNAWWNSIWR